MTIQSKSRQLMVILAIMAIFIMQASAVSAATVQLPKGTEVKISFAPGIILSSGSL